MVYPGISILQVVQQDMAHLLIGRITGITRLTSRIMDSIADIIIKEVLI
jgi:hypothetical protein